MGQVNSVSNYRKPSTGEALTRAFQMYKDFQQGGESSSRADLLDQQNEALQSAQDREDQGVFTPKEELGLATSGKFKEFGVAESPDQVPEGAFKYKTTDQPDVIKFGVPKPFSTELRTPDLKPTAYTDEKGDVRLGAFDPATGKVVKGEDDPLAPKQPSSEVDKLSARDSAKEKKTIDDKFMKLNKELNTGTASSRSDLGKQQGVASAADRVLTLGEQAKTQEGGLDKRQIHELALAVANLVSGGTGTAQATVEALVPKSAGTSITGIEEWLSADPKGTNQQAFVDRMLETADREKYLANEKIKGYKGQTVAAYADLADVDPDKFKKIVGRHFGEDAKFDQFGNYQSQPYQGRHGGGAPNGPTGFGTANAAPGGFKPGSIIERGGKRFQVGADGKSATEVQ